MKARDERGMALVAVVMYLGIVTLVGSAFCVTVHRVIEAQVRIEWREAGMCLADAGVDKALASLCVDPAYRGERDTALGDGDFSVTVEPAEAADTYRIASTGRMGDATRTLAESHVVVEAVVTQGRVAQLRRLEEASK